MGALAPAALALPFWGGARAWARPPDTGLPSQAASNTDPGAIAAVTMEQFSETVGTRPSGSWGAIRAREFIVHALQQYGYQPAYQEFIAGRGDTRVQSANVVAVKPGDTAETIVLGAHYDTVPGSPGAGDNASGVGLLIEMAGRLADAPTPYTIAFVAFGAEKPGLYGSRYFLKALGASGRKAVMGMINLDRVAGGETLYVYGVEGEGSWLQKDILAAARMAGVTLATDATLQLTPPVTAGQSYEVTGDHVPFAARGVPVAGFISAAAPLRPTRASFWPMDTPDDTVATLERQRPGRARRQLRDLATLLEVVLTSRLATEP